MSQSPTSPTNIQPATGKPKTRKSRLFYFSVTFVLLFGLTIGAYKVWYRYFTDEGRQEAAMAESVGKYNSAIKTMEDALRADTYGGKTPQETLNMFVSALKAGNLDLASKYFYLDTNPDSPDYLTRKKWEEGLKKSGADGRVPIILKSLSTVKITGQTEFGATFESFDARGDVSVLVELRLNKYSGVWKIESM